MPNADDSLPPSGQTLQKAFNVLVETLNEQGIRYAIIDGLATIQHTRIRTTDDIDVLLTVPQIAMPAFFGSLRARGFNVDVLRSIQEFRDGSLTTIRFADVLIDLMKPMIPAYAHVLDRAISAEILGQRVRVSSAEGLILMKLIAMRPQNESDIRDLLAAYAGKLDLKWVRAELEALTNADDPRRADFELWIRQAGGGWVAEP